MSAAFLIQLLISAIAVAAMVGLAAWLGIPRAIGGMTKDQVRALLAEEHPDMPVDRMSIALDGKSAVVLSGQQALIVNRVGDGHVVEVIPAADLRIKRRGLFDDPERAPQTDAAA